MVAYRTFFRSLFSDNNLTAVSADPNLFLFTLENTVILDVCKKRTISFLMLFFNLAYYIKQESKFIKAFLFGNLSKFGIHFGPLIVFACSCILQIFNSLGNSAAMQCLEP